MADQSSAQRPAQSPAVAVHPPAIFLGCLIAGCILALLVPFGPGLARGSANAFWVGLAFTALGIGISIWAAREIVRAGSHVPTWQPTTALVTDGPFQLSRNPIYIGMITLFFGVAVMLTNAWMLILLPLLIWLLQVAVVDPEEAFLAERFGAAYRDYQRTVPRWL